MSPIVLVALVIHSLTLFSIFLKVDAKCELFSDQNIQVIIDYIKWRKINRVIFLDDELKLATNMYALRKNLKCFNQNNVFINLCTNVNATKFILSNVRRKTILITLLKTDINKDKFISETSHLTSFGETVAWFILSCNMENMIDENVLDILRDVSFDLNSDVLLALSNFSKPDEQIMSFESHCSRNTIQDKVSQNLNRILPFYEWNNDSLANISSLCLDTTEYSNITMCILQIYKIRKNLNTSLVVQPLGFWNGKHGFENVQHFESIEKRYNFLDFPLIIGTKNISQSGNIPEETGIEESNDEDNMNEILEYIVTYLNANQTFSNFTKLGTKEANGAWTDLLGAVTKQEVDFALDTVIKTSERYHDMIFSHNIMQSIRNIYVKPEKSSKLRDIFTVPFGQNLSLSLIGTALIIAITLTIYKIIVFKFCKKHHDHKVLRHFSDSTIWCVAIFSMQGNIWSPLTYAGNIIAIVSLLCALIAYNSYSAFITSVLSVQLMNIHSVADLLDSDYHIGYVKNSMDEIYLRSTNISQLNQIYLRGYLDNNINNITEGLMKTTKGNYGFFATGHIARKQLLNISSYKCTYNVVEIPVHATKNTVAFPMPKNSPYKKLINLGIIKMYESGIHKYIQSQISPPLRTCEKPRTYQSARLSDLSSAFFVLAFGAIIANILLATECVWKKRNKLHRSIGKRTLNNSNANPTYFPVHSGLYPPPLRVVGGRRVNNILGYLE